MKLEIFEDKSQPKDEPIRLRLVSKGGNISVQVVDKNGERRMQGDLLIISQNGIYRVTSVNPDFGLNLEPNGRLMLQSRG